MREVDQKALDRAIDDIKSIVASNEYLSNDLSKYISLYNQVKKERDELQDKYNKLCIRITEEKLL